MGAQHTRYNVKIQGPNSEGFFKDENFIKKWNGNDTLSIVIVRNPLARYLKSK